MAITITPREQGLLVDAMNKDFLRRKREDFDIRLDKLPKAQQEAPLEKLFEKEANNKEFTDLVQQLREQHGEEVTDTMLKHYVKFGGYHDPGDKDPTDDAFYSLRAPKELMVPIYVSYWKTGKDKYDHNESSDDILDKMSPEERAWFLKKLDFPAVWTDDVPEGSIALHAPVPLKNKTFNARFQMQEFLAQAKKVVDRPNKGALVDKESLIENLTEVIEEKAKADADYYDTEESWGDEGYNAKEDVKHKKWSDLMKDIDDEDVMRYIEKLQANDVDEDDIKEMLADTADEEFNDSHYNVDDSIGMTHLSSENELYLDNRDEWVEDTADKKWPYPGDFDANLALLNEEDCEEIRKHVNSGSARFKWDESMQQFVLDTVTVYLGDNRSLHLVLNSKKFIMDASRKLKDKMLHPRRGAKKKAASVERFPATSAVLRNAAPRVSERFPTLARVLKKT